MENIKHITFRRGVGNYLFIVDPDDDGILVVYKRFSQPNEFFVVSSSGRSLSENFSNAVKEVKEITEIDAIVIAFHLGISMVNSDGQPSFGGGQLPFCGGFPFPCGDNLFC